MLGRTYRRPAVGGAVWLSSPISRSYVLTADDSGAPVPEQCKRGTVPVRVLSIGSSLDVLRLPVIPTLLGRAKRAGQ